MTDTEDPNIATLREALAALYSEMNEVADYEENEWRGNLRKANAAADGLASTLAERDERIRALEAPPAPAPGELAAGLCSAANNHDVLVTFGGTNEIVTILRDEDGGDDNG